MRYNTTMKKIRKEMSKDALKLSNQTAYLHFFNKYIPRLDFNNFSLSYEAKMAKECLASLEKFVHPCQSWSVETVHKVK